MMDTKYDRQLRELARLAVLRGIALQPGEIVGISAPVSCCDFVRLLEEEAFLAGAANVFVQWEDPHLRSQRILHASQKMICDAPEWEFAALEYVAKNGGCLIQVRSPLFEENEPQTKERAELLKMVENRAGSMVMKKKMTFACPWVVVLLPNIRWAKKVYPDLPPEKAYETLAETLMDCARIQETGTIEAWDAHCASLRERAVQLTEKRIQKLHYRNSIGTDFTVELAEPYSWSGGAVHLPSGRKIIPNLPTEELASVPKADSAQGDLVATKPFVFGDELIEGMRLHFHKGIVTAYSALSGAGTLKRMLEMDANGAGRRLGEVALVPYSCRISQKNVIFFNTILDENASCHMALGNAYGPDTPGVNKGASFHADFMIGSSDMEITARCADGQDIPVFHKGEWAFQPSSTDGCKAANKYLP